MIRDPADGPVPSSRNVFLSAAERRFAPTLYDALLLAEKAWDQGWSKSNSVGEAIKLIQSHVQAASEYETRWNDIGLRGDERCGNV